MEKERGLEHASGASEKCFDFTPFDVLEGI